MRLALLLIGLVMSAEPAFAAADCPQLPKTFKAPLEKPIDEPIEDELGTIYLKVGGGDNMSAHGVRLDVAVKCKNRPDTEIIIENELICDFRTSTWDPCTKELVLRYSLEKRGNCSTHNRQVFSLTDQCADSKK